MKDDLLYRTIGGCVLFPNIREAQVGTDVFRSDGDDGKVTAVRTQYVGGGEYPGWVEEGSAAKPAIHRHT